jgi:hypothetical protein
VPDSILPPHKMEKLLLDMLRAEEFFNLKQRDSVARDSFNLTTLYQSVLAIHKTNKENFKKSFTFYEKHPDLLKPVLDSIHSDLLSKSIEKTKTPARIKKALKK